MRTNPARARVRSYAPAFVIAVALAFPAAALPVEAHGSPTATTSSIRIDNFGRVDSHLYRGGQPEGHDFADLKALGVRTIVNLTSDDADPQEKAMAEAAGITYVQIPMTTHTVPTPAQVARFLGIVNDPASGPVFVHCVGGRHRTGVMTAANRIAHDGWTGEQAFKEMKQYKFGSDFLHAEFKQFVYGYRPAAPTAAATAAIVQR